MPSAIRRSSAWGSWPPTPSELTWTTTLPSALQMLQKPPLRAAPNSTSPHRAPVTGSRWCSA
ncbi:hypothetical protein V2I01_43245 [Micromonospora sp. BRA006-A]|nr:hypothetical protein [Micromonospora sp. BRA006-A]